MKFRMTCLTGVFALLALALGSNPAGAGIVTFTATGTGSDGPLSATADFTTSAGQVFVTLTNTLGADVIRSAGQALSDISFTLSNAPGTLGTPSASGQLGDITSTGPPAGGTVDFVAGDPTRWLGAGGQGNFGVSGNTVTLETIGGGQPTQMIIPFVANGGTYANVNPGFPNFNPYVIGPASFTILLTGVTENTTVTAATFSFGTGPDTFIPGTAVPEPTSMISALIGMATLGFMGLRRSKRTVKTPACA